MPVSHVVFGFGAHSGSGFILFSPSGGAPDATSLSRWGREIVPAVRQAVRQTGAAETW